MGHRNKCAYCGERAIAYRLAPAGSKTPLCYKHIPVEEPSIHSEAELPVDKSGRLAFGWARYMSAALVLVIPGVLRWVKARQDRRASS
jgi:hypothetical protein